MKWWIKDIILLLELLLFWIIGFFLTLNVLNRIFESNNIEFLGNLWINWFGIAYFLFVLYSITAYLLTRKNIDYYKGRMRSIIFWLLFIGSIYIVFIPFFKGENPF